MIYRGVKKVISCRPREEGHRGTKRWERNRWVGGGGGLDVGGSRGTEG